MKLNKIFLGLILFISMISFANAVDYNNISFTNEEFQATSTVATKVIQFNETHIAVAYTDGADSNRLKIAMCLIDGTSCTESTYAMITSIDSLDLFFDEANDNFIITGSSATLIRSYKIARTNFNTGTLLSVFSGDANYVSTVQTNSTHYAVAYEDVTGGGDASLIICALDVSSCGTAVDVQTAGTNTYIKLIKTSNDELAYLYVNSVTPDIKINIRDLDGSAISGPTQISAITGIYTNLIEGSDNKLKIIYRDNNNGGKGTFKTCDLDGTNCGTAIVYSTAQSSYSSLNEFNEKIFVNYQDGSTLDLYGTSVNFNLTGGELSNYSIFSINETYYTNSIITTNNQLLISYYDLTATKSMLAISEELQLLPVVTINYPVDSTTYNTTSFTLNVSTDINTNLSYELNAASNISMCTNCNSSTNISITAVEGVNNLTVYSNLSGEITSDTISFTVDTTNPSLNVSLPSEFNSYNGFNFSQYINVSDTNLDTCIVEISGETNSTCSETNYNFTTNGNKTINITATDLAGNINTSLNNYLIVNPYQYFNFESPASTPIENFTFNGVYFNDTASFKIFDMVNESDLPINATFLFEKAGYEDTNITIEFNSTSSYNSTNTIQIAKIIVNIYDRQTEALLTQNVTLTLIGPLGKNATTDTGQYNFSDDDFTSGSYQLIAETADYASEQQYFDFTNQEVITINIYMLNETATQYGQQVVRVVDNNGFYIEGAIVQLREWDSNSSAYVLKAEGQTNVLGKTIFSVEVGNKLYKFYASKDDLSTSLEPFIIQDTTDIIVISLLEDETIYDIDLDGITGTLTPTNLSGNQTRLTFEYEDSGSSVTQGCIKVYKRTGGTLTLLNESCVAGSSNTILYDVFNNESYTQQIEGIVTLGSENITLDFYTIYPKYDIDLFNFEYLIPLIVFIAFFAFGMWMGEPIIVVTSIGVSFLVNYLLMRFIFSIDLYSTQTFGLIIVMCLLTAWGVYKRK